MKAFSASLLTLILSSVTVVHADCWSSVQTEKLQQDWRLKNHNKFLRVDLDLDGDGKLDFSEFKISCDKKRIALFAFILQRKNTYKDYLLTDVAIDEFPDYGIKVVPTGDYKTACGKGYFDCVDENESQKLINHSIELFKYQGVSSIFYWNVVSKSFSRVWLND